MDQENHVLHAFILYQEYSIDRVKVPLRIFQEMIGDKLMHYDEDEWPDSSNRIPSAPLLPVDQRYDDLPVVDAPPQPTSTPGPSSVMPGPCISALSDPQVEVVVDDPSIILSCRPYAKYVVDHPDHLIPAPSHVLENVRRMDQKKQCRVCFLNGLRNGTSFQYTHCKIALCRIRDCFRRYHTDVVFRGTSPGAGTPGTGSRLGSGGRRYI